MFDIIKDIWHKLNKGTRSRALKDEVAEECAKHRWCNGCKFLKDDGGCRAVREIGDDHPWTRR